LNIQNFASQFFVIYDFLKINIKRKIIVKVAKVVGHVN
jgi:hypothetical protein